MLDAARTWECIFRQVKDSQIREVAERVAQLAYHVTKRRAVIKSHYWSSSRATKPNQAWLSERHSASRTAKAFVWQYDSLHERGAVRARREDERGDADRVLAVPGDILQTSQIFLQTSQIFV